MIVLTPTLALQQQLRIECRLNLTQSLVQAQLSVNQLIVPW